MASLVTVLASTSGRCRQRGDPKPRMLGKELSKTLSYGPSGSGNRHRPLRFRPSRIFHGLPPGIPVLNKAEAHGFPVALITIRCPLPVERNVRRSSASSCRQAPSGTQHKNLLVRSQGRRGTRHSSWVHCMDNATEGEESNTQTLFAAASARSTKRARTPCQGQPTQGIRDAWGLHRRAHTV